MIHIVIGMFLLGTVSVLSTLGTVIYLYRSHHNRADKAYEQRLALEQEKTRHQAQISVETISDLKDSVSKTQEKFKELENRIGSVETRFALRK